MDARFAKPLDEKLILELATNHELVITIEEGSVGGFGSHVMQLLSERGVFDGGLKFRSMILPDVFIDQDTPYNMYDKAGLNSSSIVKKLKKLLIQKWFLLRIKIWSNHTALYLINSGPELHNSSSLLQWELPLYQRMDHASL